MLVEKTPLPDVLIITPVRHTDQRGVFSESYHQARFTAHGINSSFVQDNCSVSEKVGTVRGLHFQAPPHAQAKLVRCTQGRILDVAVDLRRGSPTFGKAFGVELSQENGKQLFVPEGFAHGFVTRDPHCQVIYKCSDYYAPDSEWAILWDDPMLAIDWGIDGKDAVLSDKDAKACQLRDFDSPFHYVGESP